MSEYQKFDPENPDAGFPAQFSHFILHKRLGAGGMGTTFLAEDEALGRKVAIKIMQKELGADANAFEAFKNEAQSAAKLNHPNVAQIYSFGQEEGCPYLEMELVPGGDLAHLMEDPGTLDPAFVLRVGFEIAKGLKAAEDGGLFHGDVKPDNILFDEKGLAKLVDFGIASRAGKGASEEVWGTPYYIAPEKVQKKTDSARSDIYSLGATLYHAITGVPPYDGETPIDVVKARFNGNARPIDEIRPEVEPEVVRIVSRMMSNDLFLRYPNYNSLIGDLGKYLSSVPAFRSRGPVGAVREAVKSATGTFAESELEEAQTKTGKKKFVIQKGQLEGAATGSFTAARPSDTPTGAKKAVKFSLKGASVPTAAPTVQSQAAEVSEEDRRRRAAKGVRVMVTIFSIILGLIILGVVGFFVKKVMDSKEGERQLAQYKLDAETCQTQIEELTPQFEKTLVRIRNFDEQAKKKYEEVAEIIRKATDIDFEMPDLEPPPEEDALPVPAGAGMLSVAAAPTDILTALLANDKVKKNDALVGALGAFVSAHPEARTDADLLAKINEKLNDPVMGSNDALLKGAIDGILSGYTPPAAEAPAEEPAAEEEEEEEEEAEPEPEPEPAPAVELTPEEKAEAEKRNQAKRDYEMLRDAASSSMDESARVIRAALRKGESFKAKAEDMDERLDFKPTDSPYVIYKNRKAVLDERHDMLKQMGGLVKDCEKAFKGGVSHGVAAVVKAARPINARRLREAEEAERARALAAKEAKDRAERDSAEAKRSEEVTRIQDLCAKNQGLIDAFEYEKFRKQLSRMEAELTTEGAREELAFTLKRIDAVESLRKWVFDDLRKNGEVKRGWRNRYDIVGVSLSAPELRISSNQPNVPIDKLNIGDWNTLFALLLEARPPTRHGLDSIERGNQLFNAAVFCYLHGKGDERALERSKKLAKEAFKYRSALENDVKKFLPFYENDAPPADDASSAPAAGGDAFWN